MVPVIGTEPSLKGILPHTTATGAEPVTEKNSEQTKQAKQTNEQTNKIQQVYLPRGKAQTYRGRVAVSFRVGDSNNGPIRIRPRQAQNLSPRKIANKQNKQSKQTSNQTKSNRCFCPAERRRPTGAELPSLFEWETATMVPIGTDPSFKGIPLPLKHTISIENLKANEQTERTETGASPVARHRPRGAWLPSSLSMGDSNSGPNRYRPNRIWASTLSLREKQRTIKRETKQKQNQNKLTTQSHAPQ